MPFVLQDVCKNTKNNSELHNIGKTQTVCKNIQSPCAKIEAKPTILKIVQPQKVHSFEPPSPGKAAKTTKKNLIRVLPPVAPHVASI